MEKTNGARIVSVTSTYAFNVKKPLSKEWLADTKKDSAADMQSRYELSKAMNYLFCKILADKLATNGYKTISVLAHPGFAKTEFANNMEKSFMKSMIKNIFIPLFAQSAEMGAAPLLYAATHESVYNGDFIGPSGSNEASGTPHHSKAKIKGVSKDIKGFGAEMWKWLEEWSGVTLVK